MVVLALVSGYVGFAAFLAGNPRFSHGPLDLLYDDLQLFVLGPFPLQQGDTHLPVALQIGRLVAPLVTIFAFIDAGRLFLAAELQRRRVQRLRNHVVVCGAGPVAAMLARRLTESGDQVVVVRPGPVEGSGSGRGEVHGDPRLPEVLRAASAHRARTLYACTDSMAVNTAIAIAVARMATGNGPELAVYVHAPDADLCHALQARHLGRTRSSRARVEFFNIDEVAARKLVADRARDEGTDKHPHVLVIGATTFGRAVVVELARHWQATRSDCGAVPTVVLADEHASSAVAELTHRYQFVPNSCHLRAHDGPLVDLLAGQYTRPTDVFVCLADEEACLRTALTMDGLWHGGVGSVIVRLGRLADFPDMFHGADGDVLLDANKGVLRLFDVIAAAGDPAMIRDDLVERLARVVHDQYRRTSIGRGKSPDGSPSTMPWDRLPETLRQSCRNQAEDVNNKLGAIGYALAPRVVEGEDYQLTEDTIEELARMEHHRWTTERHGGGWTYGPTRDNCARRHPDLVSWERLSPLAQSKNRDAMRELGSIVGDAGFRIVQL
jgi:voltage-gated potassium channel Kch